MCMYNVICLVIAVETKEKSYEKPEDRQIEGFGRRGTGAFHGRPTAGVGRDHRGEAAAGAWGLAEGG